MTPDHTQGNILQKTYILHTDNTDITWQTFLLSEQNLSETFLRQKQNYGKVLKKWSFHLNGGQERNWYFSIIYLLAFNANGLKCIY